MLLLLLLLLPLLLLLIATLLRPSFPPHPGIPTLRPHDLKSPKPFPASSLIRTAE